MNTRKLLKCNICGNVIEKLSDSGVNVVCCGQPMKPMEENTIDTKYESHLPVAEYNDGILLVKVGNKPHPMTEEHYIQWIMVAQGERTFRVDLKPGDLPQAEFKVDEKPYRVYSYCNLHGLWTIEKN